MRAVVQRVHRATVEFDRQIVGAIGPGLLVFLSAGRDDDASDVRWMVEKLVGLRIFVDDDGKMSRDVRDAAGAVLVVSQFTLHGDVRRGKRPSFTAAMAPDSARAMIADCAKALATFMVATPRGPSPLQVEQGVFGADMKVELVNDGPVTILIDSKRTF
jgi:D-aminoacyl-tRNA deacylase